MRFIDLNTFIVDVDWNNEASNHKTNVINSADRSDYFNTNKHWNDVRFRLPFVEHGHNKCWYSEAGMGEGLFIDHFRPKLRATRSIGIYPTYSEGGTRPLLTGYYWLGYDYRNFRVAGYTVNGIKKGYFPIKQGTASVNNHNPGDVTGEEYMLLDPCNRQDLELLVYDFSKPKPRYNEVQETFKYHRAAISIEIYGLKNSLLDRKRRRVLQRCNEFIEAAELYHNRDNEQFAEACANLVAMLMPEKEFTMMILHRLISQSQEWCDTHVINRARQKGYVN